MNFLSVIFLAISIQMVFSNDGNQGIPSEYLSKVQEVYNLALENPAAATEKLQQYMSAKLPDNVKSLMQQAVDSPSKVKSMLEQTYNQLPNVDKDALWYRAIGKPLWNLGAGTGYIGWKVLGFGVQTIGEFSKLFVDSVQDSSDAIKEKTQSPVANRASDIIGGLNSKLQWVQDLGTSMQNNSNNGINGLHGKGPSVEKSSHTSEHDN